VTIGRLGCAIGWRRLGDLVNLAALVFALGYVNVILCADPKVGELLGPNFEFVAAFGDDGRDLLAELRRVGFCDLDQHGTCPRVARAYGPRRASPASWSP